MRQIHGLETLGNEHPVTVCSVPAEWRSLNCIFWKTCELVFKELLTEYLDKLDSGILFAIHGRRREGEPRNKCKFLAGRPVGRRERRY